MGKKTETESFQANYAQYIKEKLFEDMRVNKCPDAPSRLASVFLCPDLVSAKFYRSQWHNYQSFIYKARIQNGHPFVVEMNLLNCNGHHYDIIKKQRYQVLGQAHHNDSCTLEAILDGEAVIEDLVCEPSII